MLKLKSIKIIWKILSKQKEKYNMLTLYVDYSHYIDDFVRFYLYISNKNNIQ